MQYLRIDNTELNDFLFPYRVSEKQIELMLHAIGADSKKAKPYRKGLFYYAYRNGFDASGSDIELWEDLKAKEYATKERVYHVSPIGINFLERITHSTIYLYDCVGDAKSHVLTALIKSACYCGYGCWNPTPMKSIAKRIHAPLRVVKECLSELENEGLVKRTHEGGQDEDGYAYCFHGWALTEKAYELDEYKKAWNEECEYLNKTLNTD